MYDTAYIMSISTILTNYVLFRNVCSHLSTIDELKLYDTCKYPLHEYAFQRNYLRSAVKIQRWWRQWRPYSYLFHEAKRKLLIIPQSQHAIARRRVDKVRFRWGYSFVKRDKLCMRHVWKSLVKRNGSYISEHVILSCHTFMSDVMKTKEILNKLHERKRAMERRHVRDTWWNTYLDLKKWRRLHPDIRKFFRPI